MPVHTILLSTFILYIIMIDIFLLFHQKKKYEEALSHCCQSHPQSTHQAPGFSTKPTRYILSKLCLLLKSYFLTPLAGPSGVKGMFEFDKRFSGGAKNCKRKTDNIIGMSKITTNIAIIRQIHKCTSE